MMDFLVYLLRLIAKFVFDRLAKPLLKWYVRKRSGKTDLSKLMLDGNKSLSKVMKIENLLRKSKKNAIKEIAWLNIINLDDIHVYVEFILEQEGVLEMRPSEVETCRKSLTLTLRRMSGYKDLSFKLTNLGKTQYNSKNQNHETFLKELWNRMNPFDTLENRVSPRWRTMGFAHCDPLIDFRPPTGILALRCLHHFSVQKNEQARYTYSNSHHPERWYRWATAGIALCTFLASATADGSLRNHYYHCEEEAPGMEEFFETYAAAFIAFDRYWRCKYGTFAEFPRIFQDFKEELLFELRDPDVILTHDILNKVKEVEKLDSKDAEWREMMALAEGGRRRGGRGDGGEGGGGGEDGTVGERRKD